MINHSKNVQARKNVKRGFGKGDDKMDASPAATLYNAQDLHQRQSFGSSAGQAFVPDWNAPSSFFSPKRMV